MPGKFPLGYYFRTALFNPLNLLLAAAAAAGAYFSPWPETALIGVAAAEAAYLALRSTSAGYQNKVDAQLAEAEENEKAESMRVRFNKLYYGLDTAAQAQFNELRDRCKVMRESHLSIDDEMRPNQEAIADMQVGGVNKLLWVYLKLLHTRAMLQNYFKTTNENEIKNLIESTRVRLEALKEDRPGDMDDKMRNSLKDTLQTATSRMENWHRAKENAEYIALELERIAAKLTALAELAVNRQDPGKITSEVEQVTQSVEITEQTMAELREITGFTADDLAAPAILTRSSPRLRARA